MKHPRGRPRSGWADWRLSHGRRWDESEWRRT